MYVVRKMVYRWQEFITPYLEYNVLARKLSLGDDMSVELG